jgi:hypothetical protein
MVTEVTLEAAEALLEARDLSLKSFVKFRPLLLKSDRFSIFFGDIALLPIDLYILEEI